MEALKWLRQAHDLEQRAGDAKTRASTFLNLCAVYSLLGRHVDALQSATHALKLLKTAIQSDPDISPGIGMMEKVDPASMLAIAYHNIAVEQEHLERYTEAYQSYSKALDVAEDKCGSSTPLTSKIRSALANAASAAKISPSAVESSLAVIRDKSIQQESQNTEQTDKTNDSASTSEFVSGSYFTDAASIVAPLVPSRQESHRANSTASEHISHGPRQMNAGVASIATMDGIEVARTSARIVQADHPASGLEAAAEQSATNISSFQHHKLMDGSGPRSRTSGDEPRGGPEPRSAHATENFLPRSVKEDAKIKCWGKSREKLIQSDSAVSTGRDSGPRHSADCAARNSEKLSSEKSRPTAHVQRESSSTSELSIESRDCSHSSRERAKRPLSAARLPLEEDGGGSSSSNHGRHSRKTARPRTAGRERMKERDREELMALTDPSSSDAGPSLQSIRFDLPD